MHIRVLVESALCIYTYIGAGWVCAVLRRRGRAAPARGARPTELLQAPAWTGGPAPEAG